MELTSEPMLLAVSRGSVLNIDLIPGVENKLNESLWSLAANAKCITIIP
jgi:hypothetical protein